MTDLAPSAKSNEAAAMVPVCGDWDVPRAPYVDYTAYPTPEIATYAGESGVDGFIAGFIVARPGGDKKLYWGGYESYGEAGSSDFGKEDFAKFTESGGKLVLSFGGAANVLLEAEEKDIDRIVAAYQRVLDNYQVTRFNFDLEGAFLNDDEGQARHVAAVGKLLQGNPHLKLSYTLPVDGSPGYLEGFHEGGVRLLRDLAVGGIQPSLINGLLMEFGPTSPADSFDSSVVALGGMAKQIQAAWPAWGEAKVWRRIGAAPMFGRNHNGKTFTLRNMEQLVDFARQMNLGCLSGWDVTRDYNQGTLPQCSVQGDVDLARCTGVGDSALAFAKIIAQYKP